MAKRTRGTGRKVHAPLAISFVLSSPRLKQDPRHPSLHFEKVGRFWTARVGAHYRALAVEVRDGLVWFWIGSHADYDRREA